MNRLSIHHAHLRLIGTGTSGVNEDARVSLTQAGIISILNCLVPLRATCAGGQTPRASPLAPTGLSRYAGPMSTATAFEIFLAAPPGLEPVLRDEAAALGLPAPRPVPGGVTSSRRLARGLARQPARPRRLAGARPDRAASAPSTSPSSTSAPASSHGATPCARTSRSASTSPPAPAASTTPAPRGPASPPPSRETLGAPIADDRRGDPLTLKVRIDDDLCTLRSTPRARRCTAAATSRP